MRRLLNTAWPMLGRLVLALPGSYVFVWGWACLALSGLVAAGLPFHDAETAAVISSFLIYLALLLWAFATPSLPRAALLLLGGGTAMSVLAWALQGWLLSGGQA